MIKSYDYIVGTFTKQIRFDNTTGETWIAVPIIETIKRIIPPAVSSFVYEIEDGNIDIMEEDATASMPYNFYTVVDYDKETPNFIKDSRLISVTYKTAFERIYVLFSDISTMSMPPKQFINDYYSFQFDKFGIKDYRFTEFGDLIFENDVNESQFRFYFGDIIV